MFYIPVSLRAVCALCLYCLLTELVWANFSEETSTAELLFSSTNGALVPALLLESDIEGDISGLIATITIQQRYRNTTDSWVNGRYRFPLPEDAAVDSLTLETDGRILRGTVKEKKVAQQEFDAAKRAGKKAGLLKQHRPNLFSMSLANIAPRAEVTATISFVTTVEYENGVFSLRLPTTLTPRYIPGTPLQTLQDGDFAESRELKIDATAGWATNTDEVSDAADITPPQINISETVSSHRFSLSLNLDAGIPLVEIASDTHAIKLVKEGTGRQIISLANGLENLDRDLLLTWTPAASQAPEAAVFRQQGTDVNHSMVMLMPPTRNLVATLSREVIFIIDSSGSMAGLSMLQAQQGLQTALNLLSPGDRFNVIDFDSAASALFPAPRPATGENVTRASVFVNSLIADGGTNMEEALNLAFSMPESDTFLRQIVFITDGSVGNEQALFELIGQRLGQARLFTVGIGSAPNAHFMRGAARFGRGTYQFISDIALAAQNMRSLFERLNRPVMKQLKVEFDSVEGQVVYPNPLPDLYLGQPVMLTVKSAAPLASIVLSGHLAGENWHRTINAESAPEAVNIDKVWARNRVEQLQSDVVTGRLDQSSAKKMITQTGLDYQLVTPHTSFIAVEELVSKSADIAAKNGNVPNLMPAGNMMAVPVPNTATPATFMSLIGALLMLVSLAAALPGRRPVRL